MPILSEMSSLPDEELVAKILKHDREALGELFRRYQKPFFNLAYRFLGDRFLADDLVSEIFLRIYKYLKSYNVTQRFRPWAFKVATNTCLTFKVKNSKLKVQNYNSKLKVGEGEDQTTLMETISDAKVDLAAEVERNEVARRVQKALQKLPEKYRLALYLYYFEDLKYEEVAADLNLPINTIRTHIRRGKEKMQAELKDLI